MSIRLELPARYGHTQEQLSFIREMGIEYLNLNVMPDHMNEEDLTAETARLKEYGLFVSDLACPPLQKSPDIILGRSGRSGAIRDFTRLIQTAGRLNIPLVSIAWQPNGIFRTGRGPGAHTRGGTSFHADLEEINARPISNDRVYSREEMWETFSYFTDQIAPVCRSCGVRLALHPNDPPVASLGGVGSLICSSADYRHALSIAGSDVLAVKMCVGCWLENPDFGSLEDDIRSFTESGVLAEVHFRNVSGTLPRFEETLPEDGYADMYGLMKIFVRAGFDGYLSPDHAFAGYPSMGGELGSMAYAAGYIKGLLHAAEKEAPAP